MGFASLYPSYNQSPLPIKHRHRHALRDRLDARVLVALLLLAQLQHPQNIGARDEADAGVVGDDKIAGIDPHLAHLDLAVDLDGFEPPFAGRRRDLAGPDRIADRTRMPHVAHTAHDNGAALT